MTKHIFIIAEVGVNHNGSIERAKQLIDVAKESGADAVKFQTFKSESLVSNYAPKANYQLKTTDKSESQLDMLKKLELTEAEHIELFKYCKQTKIEFLSTPFDYESLVFLSEVLNLKKIKIPSGENTNAPLILEVSKYGKDIIFSTGMSTLGEIELALGVMAFGYLNSTIRPSIDAFKEAYYSDSGQKLLKEKVTLLHCNSEYPTPFEDVNLLAMDTLRKAFGMEVGYSDHTTGIAVPIAAVAKGAVMVEKHLTIDKNLPGPDHRASLEPNEFKLMVISIRQVEKALGSNMKIPSPSERDNIKSMKKSIVAKEHINIGEVFTPGNITLKRPSAGLSPVLYWDLLGKKARKEFQVNEMIEI